MLRLVSVYLLHINAALYLHTFVPAHFWDFSTGKSSILMNVLYQKKSILKGVVDLVAQNTFNVSLNCVDVYGLHMMILKWYKTYSISTQKIQCTSS